ncbi:carboxypeptidase M32 [Alphaproteobacteria bacterium GH1-50]|uniref:Metal-dependent carboxypeptidase n=1 Tax=Kangsaoukella pontilimi TaxID=2691042 RepID=A0A7C9IFU1_9RHOB|nr:carboxypeptidase M32 [Kangsaoukella pontilimi]MXQ07808.1 carboxypeptidase M32 [Kangsaoukella pontilimi]
MSGAFDALMRFQRETEALSQVMGRLGWDQETMMPEGAAEQRAEEMAALAGVLHRRRTDPRIGEWLAGAEAPDELGARQLAEVAREFERTARVPEELASALARTTSLAHRVWADARATEDFALFLPKLEEVVDLSREKGAALADGGDAYDALLEDYEPGTTAADLDAMFGALRPRLTALRDRVLGADRAIPSLGRDFDEAGQLAISTDLARAFGYDTNHGRIDKAVHPFSSGSGLDVRITTRTEAHNPANCFYSTIHEVGHATYEQGVARALLLTPLGRGASMGVHESQSRIFENQLGRSRAFTGWLHGRMEAEFGDIGTDAHGFYGAMNAVRQGYIRTEADEVNYNLHVLMRFDIERDLIAGRLAPADLPEAWDTRFEWDFGVAVDKPSNGCLQDVHWSEALFGYFPTYTLGNVYAGCLHAAIRADIPDLDDHLAKGDPMPAVLWLRERVHVHGAAKEPAQIIADATGRTPDEGPLLDYLEDKFAALYGV